MVWLNVILQNESPWRVTEEYMRRIDSGFATRTGSLACDPWETVEVALRPELGFLDWEKGIEFEADQRLVEAMVNDLNLIGSKATPTPGTKRLLHRSTCVTERRKCRCAGACFYVQF